MATQTVTETVTHHVELSLPPVPTIDLSEYFHNPDSVEAHKVIDSIRNACRSTGIFQITGHGIPKSLQKRVLAAAKLYFSLPSATKMQAEARHHLGFRGYDAPHEIAIADQAPTLREGFFIGAHLPADHPAVIASNSCLGPNIWPDPTMVADHEFRQPVEEYHSQLFTFAEKMVRLLERSLPYGPGAFDDFLSGHRVVPLRLVHYPPATENASVKANFSPHTDLSGLTFLLQDEIPGLEVLDKRTGTWSMVAPNPDAMVVNIGEIMSQLTRNEYVSTPHRVLHDRPEHRYSVVFFYNGNVNAGLEPLDGLPDSVPDRPKTVQAHLQRRMQEFYGVSLEERN